MKRPRNATLTIHLASCSNCGQEFEARVAVPRHEGKAFCSSLCYQASRARRDPKVIINPDFKLENHGSIVLVQPLSPACRSWLLLHVPDGMWWGGCLVVEPRYLETVLQGMLDEGLAE